MLPALRARMLSIPWLNIPRIAMCATIQKTRDNIRIINKHPTMKFYGDFYKRFAAQTMSGIHRSYGCSVWRIPNVCGISTGMTYIL